MRTLELATKALFTVSGDNTPLPDEHLTALEMAGVPVVRTVTYTGRGGWCSFRFKNGESAATAAHILVSVYGYTIEDIR